MRCKALWLITILVVVIAGATLIWRERNRAAREVTYREWDTDVIGVALTDFAKNPEVWILPEFKNNSIVLVDSEIETSLYDVSSDSIKRHTDGRDWEIVSPLARNLYSRWYSGSPVEWRPTEAIPARVVNLSEFLKERYDAFDFWDAIVRSHPDACCYVGLYLPGYSSDGKYALVRFSFGPTQHGADAVYLLERQTDRWTVRWSDINYYN